MLKETNSDYTKNNRKPEIGKENLKKETLAAFWSIPVISVNFIFEIDFVWVRFCKLFFVLIDFLGLQFIIYSR